MDIWNPGADKDSDDYYIHRGDAYLTFGKPLGDYLLTFDGTENRYPPYLIKYLKELWEGDDFVKIRARMPKTQEELEAGLNKHRQQTHKKIKASAVADKVINNQLDHKIGPIKGDLLKQIEEAKKPKSYRKSFVRMPSAMFNTDYPILPAIVKALPVYLMLQSYIIRNDINKYVYENYYLKGFLAAEVTLSHIEDTLSVKKSTVIRWIKTLESVGFIKVEKHKTILNRYRNIYIIGEIVDGNEVLYVEKMFNE